MTYNAARHILFYTFTISLGYCIGTVITWATWFWFIPALFLVCYLSLTKESLAELEKKNALSN